MKRKPNPLAAAHRELRAYALSCAGAYEDTPWGDSVVKVAKKIFLFLNYDAQTRRLSLSLKLADSNPAALELPFTKPTAYNLGKSGWVTSVFEGDAEPPVGILRDWVAESYDLVAPKKLRRERVVR